MSLETEVSNIFVRYIYEIVVGFIVVLLTLLRWLGKTDRVDKIERRTAQCDCITRADLLELQLVMQKTTQEQFDILRSDMQKQLHVELRNVHQRIDNMNGRK